MHINDAKLKLKLKLTTFSIVHHNKGNPFQVRLTVSIHNLLQIERKISVTHGSRRGCKLTYLSVSPFRTGGVDFQTLLCISESSDHA